jgi:NAD(P)H-hydrate epimerase
VTVYLLSQKKEVKGDAATNLHLLAPLKVPVIEMENPEAFSVHKAGMLKQNIWVDAIFGTGLNSNIKGYFKDIILFINSLKKPVFSVDIPSGLDSDTGQPCGVCIRAHTTATFAFPKIGHKLFPGAAYTGHLEIVDIGIPPQIEDTVCPLQRLLTPDYIKGMFKSREPDAHKGDTGHLLIVSGSPGKTGAAAMTAISAMRVGAGLVTLGIPKSLNPVAETLVLEAMTRPLPDTREGVLDEAAFDEIMTLLSDKKCLAIGPGIGTARETKRLVHRIIQNGPIPIVIDADGLNNLAGHSHLLKEVSVPVVMTPHPGEMARLIDTPTKEIQKNRIKFARNFAKEFQVHVVLKGAGTVIAHPDETIAVNPTGNPGMASGGMGDVLTGIIAGLITQGYSPEAASHIGVYLHGAAADTLADRIGPVGYLASEVMNAIPGEMKKLILE